MSWAAAAAVLAGGLLLSWTLVFLGLALGLLSFLLWLDRRYALERVTYTRSFSQRVVPWGSDVEVVAEIHNRKLLPVLSLEVRDLWPSAVTPLDVELAPNYRPRTETLRLGIALGWYESVRRRMHVRCSQRGLFAFGPVELQAVDLLGVESVLREDPGRHRLTVHPRVLPVTGLGRFVTRLAIERPADASLIRDPAALAGTRGYQAGDPLRDINWRATARSGSLSVNVWEPTQAAEAKILLDLRTYWRVWDGIDPELLELLCVVAGSLADALNRRGFAVGLASNALALGSRDAVNLIPQCGATGPILDALAAVVPSSPYQFSATLSDHLAVAGPEAHIVITPARTPGLGALIAELHQRSPTLVIAVGEADTLERHLVDAVVPRTFDWRTSESLAVG